MTFFGANPVFWILSVVILVSSLMVVSLKNVFHCALALIVCLFAIAGIYLLLDAEFLAAAQVLIYVGAVAILMIFAIMLTTKLADRGYEQLSKGAMVAFCVCVVFMSGILFLIYTTPAKLWGYSDKALPADNVATIGKYLMTEYMLPFEVVSVLLLTALIGAIVLARRERP